MKVLSSQEKDKIILLGSKRYEDFDFCLKRVISCSVGICWFYASERWLQTWLGISGDKPQQFDWVYWTEYTQNPQIFARHRDLTWKFRIQEAEAGGLHISLRQAGLHIPATSCAAAAWSHMLRVHPKSDDILSIMFVLFISDDYFTYVHNGLWWFFLVIY